LASQPDTINALRATAIFASIQNSAEEEDHNPLPKELCQQHPALATGRCYQYSGINENFPKKIGILEKNN
jgi:hypothetical protein